MPTPGWADNEFGPVNALNNGVPLQAWANWDFVGFTLVEDEPSNKLTISIPTADGSDPGAVPASGGTFLTLTADSGGALEWIKLKDSYIDAAAAIAGTKVAPDFGAQDVDTTGNITTTGGDVEVVGGDVVLTSGGLITLDTGHIAFGSTLPTVGELRFENGHAVVFEASGNSLYGLWLQATTVLTIGHRTAGNQPTQIEFAAGSAGATMYFAGATRFLLNSGGFTNYTALYRISNGVASTGIIEMQARTSGTSQALEVRGQDSSVASGTAGDTTVRGGDATGTTSTGGDLKLRPGAGTSAGGTLSLNAGDDTAVAQVDDDDAFKVVGSGGLEVGAQKTIGHTFTAGTSGLPETAYTSPALSNDEVAHIKVVAIALETTTPHAAGYTYHATVRHSAGSAALVGGGAVTTHEEDAAWTLTIDTSGSSWRIRVTGDGTNVVKWDFTITTHVRNLA